MKKLKTPRTRSITTDDYVEALPKGKVLAKQNLKAKPELPPNKTDCINYSGTTQKLCDGLTEKTCHPSCLFYKTSDKHEEQLLNALVRHKMIELEIREDQRQAIIKTIIKLRQLKQERSLTHVEHNHL